MNQLESLIAAAAAAVLAGLAASPHCALMCGPLASAGSPLLRARVGWHLGRGAAYASVGALLGAIGHKATDLLGNAAWRALPWVLAAGLVASALELGRRLPPLPFLEAAFQRGAALGENLSPSTRAAAMGALTPFLPCGVIYGIFLAASAAGDALGGLLVMLAFAVGATPLLVAAQAPVHWGRRLGPVAPVLRRAVPLVAAAVVVWRALHPQSAPHACD